MAATSTREGKTQQIGEVKARFDKMTSAVFLDYKGMSVETATKLRTHFRKAGVDYKVVKNTLAKRAAKGTAVEKVGDILAGPTALIMGYEDPVQAAKILTEFIEKEPKAKDAIKVRGAVVDDDEFKVAERLGQDRIDRLVQVALGVVSAHDDGEGGRAHAAISVGSSTGAFR